MWLLDANLSHKLKRVLIRSGIDCATAQERGSGELRNGDLVKVAVEAGFTCILTQDVRFIESAAKALKRHTNFGIVLVRLKQQRGRRYIDSFKNSFEKNPIVPRNGRLTEWP